MSSKKIDIENFLKKKFLENQFLKIIYLLILRKLTQWTRLKFLN